MCSVSLWPSWPAASAAARVAAWTSSGTPASSSLVARYEKLSVASSTCSEKAWLSSASRSWICAKRTLSSPCSSAPDSTKSRSQCDSACWRGALSVAAAGLAAMALYLA